jgi:homoserine dehydrogenase
VGDIGCGLIGCGTVGSGVVRLWHEPGGAPAGARLRTVAVRRRDKRRGVDLAHVTVTDDALAVARDPAIRVVIEATGDTDLGYAVACEALARGKAFITAGKALVAAHGPELEELAAVQETAFAYEASVGGAIPIVALLRQAIAPGCLEGFAAVLNGTCNFVLSALEDGVPFEQALAAARRAGLAEADSRRDTSGRDAADKLTVLARLCGHPLDAAALPVHGIDGLRPVDATFARERGRVPRLVASLRPRAGAVEAQVEPAFVPAASPLAQARNEENVVVLDLGPAGPLALTGRGAGSLPSAAAVLADVRAVVAGGRVGASCPPVLRTAATRAAGPAVHYVRLEAPGQAPLARRRLLKALASAGVGSTAAGERGGDVQAVTTSAPGAAVRRAVQGLPWPSVCVALRDDAAEGGTQTRVIEGRQA